MANSGRPNLDDSDRFLLAATSGFACIYCQVIFGSVVRRPGHDEQVTRLEGDHIVPVAWTGQAVNEGNIVASCQVCNSLKSDLIFDSVDNARRHLNRLWAQRRYVVEFIPTRSNFEDPEGWAKEYARHMRILGVRSDAE